MCCNNGVMPRSDLRLCLLPTKPSLGTLRRSSATDPFIRLSFNPLVSVRNPVGSLRIKAAVNDAFADTMSFYELLGIPETGTLVEIKQAYKQLARKYHPDVSPPDRVEEYTRRFIRLQMAYETLSDPRTRALYDRDMAGGLHLAFSTRRRCQSQEEMEERGEWKPRWEAQLSELKRRSMNKDARGNMSWGAQMRRQRNVSSTEL